LDQKTFIKCASCGVFNSGNDYCDNCGVLINPDIIREQEVTERKRVYDQKIIQQNTAAENGYLNKLKTHDYWIVRAFGTIITSVWVIVMAVGGFIAWLAAAIAA
jgi:ribosomal protein L37E